MSNFMYKRKITIDHTKIDATLTDYPVMVKLDGTNFDFTEVRSDGYDIRFYASDETTLLDYERELFDDVGEKAVIHVRVPSISSSADTDIYMCYGDATATDGQNATGVWDDNFVMVQHMGDSLADSTSNGNDGTNYGSTVVDGLNGKARSFDGVDDKISISNIPHMGNLTLQAIVLREDKSSESGIFGCLNNSNVNMHLETTKNGIGLRWRLGGLNKVDYNAIPLEQFTFVSAKYDGSTCSVTQNTEKKIGPSGSAGPTLNNVFDIGESNQEARWWKGTIDEVRISNIARSDAWIKADDYNLRTSTLLSIEVEPLDKQVIGLTLLTEPTKTTYFLNESLDLTGATVEVEYDDLSTAVIEPTSSTGFDSSYEANNQEVTITVGEYSVSFYVTIRHNYSEGLKIGIKFTEDLVGDVSGSEDAFAITGKEYKYVNGPLIDKVYQVDKVERYPVPVLYEDNFSGGTADGIEVSSGELNLQSGGSALSFDGVNDYVAVANNSAFQFGTGSFTLEAVIKLNSYGLKGQTIISKRQATESGSPQFKLSVNLDGSLGLNTYYNVASTITSVAGDIQLGIKYHIAAIRNSNGTHILLVDGNIVAQQTMAVANVTNNQPLWFGDDNRDNNATQYAGYMLNGSVAEIRIWKSARTQQEIQNNMNTQLIGNEASLAGYWKLNEGVGNIAYDSVSDRNGTISGAIWGSGFSYSESGTYSTSSIDISGLSNPLRLNWQLNAPIGTSITVETAVTDGSLPTEWTSQTNGEVISITQTERHFLWLKYTLETTDTAVTPTLKRVWLEESSAPQDKILITMDWWGKFNNAEGALTVEYDAAVGNLAGSGGAVESFVETFTPTGLVPEPNPGIEETITASPAQVVVDFLKVETVGVYATVTEKITAAPVSVTVELLHTSIVNP